jgi:Alginate lyase
MRLKSLYLIFFLLTGGMLTAQDVGLRPAEIKALRDSLQTGTADNSLPKLYDMQRRLADESLTEDPHPVDTIRTEGLLQGDPRKKATWAALGDMDKIYALALVYKVSGDRKYLRALTAYLGMWAGTDRPRGDPIDDTNLDPVIEAYDMVKGDLPMATATSVYKWLKATAEMELRAPFNQPTRATATNNWHSHRLKIVGEIAFAIGDTALQGFTIRGMREQIGRNLNPDGSSSDFVSRDALHYHVYDLEPLLTLAIVLQRATGVNYYTYVSPAGTSIRQSVQWLLPYLDGTKTHAEFVHSTVDFDRQRGQNGEAAYKTGTLFDPKNGVEALLLASYFDTNPALMSLARKLSGAEVKYPAWQAVVNGLEKR